MLKRWYEDTSSERIRAWAEEFMETAKCSGCGVYRLRKESLHFKLNENTSVSWHRWTFATLYEWIGTLKKLTKNNGPLARRSSKKLNSASAFCWVGLDYSLSTDPQGPFRGRVAAQQVGHTDWLTANRHHLHPGWAQHRPSSKDNQRLIEALKDLTTIGNTVLVVEHDKDIMLASDYLIDLGPGAAAMGRHHQPGHTQRIHQRGGITADYLSNHNPLPCPQRWDRQWQNWNSREPPVITSKM